MFEQAPITYFGRTVGRGPGRIFGIKQPDRLSHLYVIGKTGVGKTTLLETMAVQDMATGRGLCVIDPHGDLASRLVERVPAERKGDLVYLNAPDPEQPFGYNPLRHVSRGLVPLAVSGLMEAFKKLWPEAWGVRMEHILRNALYALIETEGSTLPDLLRLLREKPYRREIASRLRNEQVKTFWAEEFKDYNPRYRQEAIAPIQNKVGAFLADPRLLRMFTKPPIDLHFRTLMDESRILIVNLSKGRLGDDSATLLGAILVTTLGLAGLSRVDQPESARRPFFIYIDEFQSFTTLSVANMVSELRKFGVGLTLANQHLHQLEPDVRHAVLGNVGTVLSFRVGPDDAQLLSRELGGTFSAEDFMRLPNRNFYVTLLIDGAPSRPFSAESLHPTAVTQVAEATKGHHC